MPADFEKLLKLIEILSFAIERNEIYPSRPELHKRLEAIENAARLLTHELPDPKIVALLLDGDERIENENEIYHGLCDLAARAARVRARTPRKQGRGKFYPKAAIGPDRMDICALMVGLMFERGSGRWPGKGNAEAHRLCEALWKAAGGPRRLGSGEPRSPSPTKETKAAGSWGKSGSATVEVWRRHLAAARKYRPPHAAGMHIQRILSPDIGHPAKRENRLISPLYDNPISRSRRAAREANARVEKEGGRKKID
jgi:hypothetical protein